MKLNKLFSHRVLGLIISILLFASLAFAAAGDIDTTFTPNLSRNLPNNSDGGLSLQSDGKILILKNYQEANDSYRSLLYRVNADGTLDTTFTWNGYLTYVYRVMADNNGKIFVAGSIDSVSTIIRLRADGSLDNTFNFNTSQCVSCGTGLTKIQNDGKLYATKSFSGSFYASTTLYRYNADGSQDISFTPLEFNVWRGERLNKLVILSNGKLVVAGGSFQNGVLFRLNSDGTKDTSFESPIITDPSCGIRCIPTLDSFILKDNGKVIVLGVFASINGVSTYKGIARLNSDGSVDMSYTPRPLASLAEGGRFAETLSDGRYVVYFASNFSSTTSLVRYNVDDTVDSTFNPVFKPNFFVIDSFNKITTSSYRLRSDGSLDTSFNPAIPTIGGQVTTLARQPDGKIIAAGNFIKSNTDLRTRLVRLNLDGTTDTTFNASNGFNSDPKIITTQLDGKILAGGTFTTFNGVSKPYLARLNSDGSLDTSFNTVLDGGINIILPLSGGKLLIGGDFSAFNGVARPKLARLNPDGTLDSTFSASANGTVYSIIQQSDGKFMVGGNFNAIGGFARTHIARINADGSADGTFNAGANFAIGFSIIQQPNGKYLVHAAYPSKIVRLNSDGSLDSSFANIEIVNGGSSVTPFINSMYLQSDGLIVIGGIFTSVNGTPRKNLARLKTDGTLDAAYVAEGTDEQINAMVGQPDGKLFVGGNFSNIGGVARTGLARINNIALIGARPLFDFDADGKADIAVYRASTNTWYRILSGNSTLLQSNFGIANDIPVPADYDGDGKTDLAIFRPSTGTFWYLSSISNAQIANQWGQSGDVPRPSDFDGDGKSDFVIYRPSEGNWYRLGSTGQVSNKPFGAVGDKPVIGDFDGDGKSDVAIYRPTTGTWWYQSSINNAQIATQFGNSSDIPSPADFDGDGKTDFAVFRPTTGVWYILNSQNGSATIIPFGISEDKPIAADYDGDGKADIAVFRPSQGLWYLLRSTSGFAALQFGVSSDVPTPNAFVP
jgi:uncharacterized delta-60 repeat protein